MATKTSPVYSDPGQELSKFEQQFKQTGGDFSDYKIANYTYPTGLGVKPDLQHYLSFFINVRGKSTFDKDNRKDVPISTAGQNRLDPKAAGSALPVVAGTLTAVGGGVQVAKDIMSGNVRKAGKDFARDITAAAAVSGLMWGMQRTPLLKPDTTYRLKDVITLHLEERPAVKYSVNYQNRELGGLAGLLTGGGSAVDTNQSLGDRLLEYTALAGAAMSKIPGIVGATSISNLVQASAKVATNPFREVFFESVDFRTFNFRYRFLPKNKVEVENVKNIIHKFKTHMHPELSANGLFYIYPSEFEIKYFYRGKENQHVQKISTCVLTDLTVEYGGEQFSSFEGGEPVEVALNLSFRELETMTRQRVEEGY